PRERRRPRRPASWVPSPQSRAAARGRICGARIANPFMAAVLRAARFDTVEQGLRARPRRAFDRADGMHMIYVIRLVSPEARMHVAKWGNSLAVRLPRSVVEALGLKEGDSIEIHVAGKRTFEIARVPGAR